MYYHQSLLEDNLVDVQSLPAALQQMIMTFNEQLYDLSDAEDEEATPQQIKEIKQTLKSLDKTLSSEIKRLIDQEPRQELQGNELKLSVLKALAREGRSSVSVKELQSMGYPLKNTVKFTEHVGPYQISKGRYQSECTILG